MIDEPIKRVHILLKKSPAIIVIPLMSNSSTFFCQKLLLFLDKLCELQKVYVEREKKLLNCSEVFVHSVYACTYHCKKGFVIL